MMKLRVVIADDEPLARERLRAFLEKSPDVEITAEAGDGKSAVSAILESEPNLVFLDIKMPELDGFGVVEVIGPGRMPPVIFTTAYDQFALKAFEVHALDYLLKPFDFDRFQTAVERARQKIEQQNAGTIHANLSAWLSQARPESKPMDRLAIKTGGRVLILKLDEIDYVEAADNYVNLHVARESHLHRETLSELESRLPSDRFARLNRSTLVNIDRIKELQPLFHGDYSVILRNGTRLTLSRNFRERLDSLLGK